MRQLLSACLRQKLLVRRVFADQHVCLVGEDAVHDLDIVVEPPVSDQVPLRTDRAVVQVPGTENESLDSGHHDGAGPEHSRLQGGNQRASFEAPRRRLRGGGTQGNDLGAGRGVAGEFSLVGALTEQVAVGGIDPGSYRGVLDCALAGAGHDDRAPHPWVVLAGGWSSPVHRRIVGEEAQWEQTGSAATVTSRYDRWTNLQERNRDVASSVTTLAATVGEAVSRALAGVVPAELADADPLIRRSEYADYQSNVPLALAKRVGAKPRDLAQSIAADVARGGFGVEVAGPGFVNITAADTAVWGQVAARASADRLGVAEPYAGRRTVVDYSSPNIAKQMHVGHLRSTVIGDAIVRLLGFLGVDVARQNHLGDWGTQFGMLIQYIDEHPEQRWHQSDFAGRTTESIAALDALYKQARAKFDADSAFADRARARVVGLQGGDTATLAVWRDLVAESERAFAHIYRRLDVLLAQADSAGESTYNRFLDEVVDELVDKGIGVDSDGALCVFFDDITGPDGQPVPLIVRKSDGGYGYAATDLATIRYRVNDLKADQILYVVDARQAQHFTMVFAAARRAGWLPDDVDARHVPFGTILGPDGRPFKTRSGETVSLDSLLDEAVNRARAVLDEKDHDLAPAELEDVVVAAGIGSVKYADLSTNRVKDYTFDLDRMVSFTGNTGVYLQYAHARIRSILRNAADDNPGVDVDLSLHPAERALALALDDFETMLIEAADALEPHRVCNYLYALARAFSDFYEQCPVLKADSAAVRGNRLVLCALTGDTLAQGLELLGIAAPARI